MIEKTFHYTFKDFLNFYLFAYKKLKWPLIIFLIVVVLNIAFSLKQFYSILNFIPILLFIFYFIFSYYRIIKKQLKNEQFKNGVNYRFEMDKIYFKSIHSEGNVSWKAIKNVVTTKNYIYLFLQNKSGYILPKREFSSGELIELNQILKENKLI